MKLEDELQWRLPIRRFNIVCGAYGVIVTDASQWQSFVDDGEYVEYTDHQEIVNLYAAEVRRLRKYIDEVL